MKKFLSLLFAVLCTAVPAFAVRTNVSIVPMQSVTATGGLNDLSVAPYTRAGSFSVNILNTAGTNPTLAVKLQQAANPAVNVTYTVTGTTDDELREGATTKVQLAAKFTQSGAKSIKYIDLWLAKEGTLTAGKKLTLTIYTNSAGVPSATVVGAASNTVDIDTEVTTSFTWVRFTFPKPVDVADSTIYHAALSGDYTVSGSNNVMWKSTTVASAGNQSTNDATNWTAVATQSHRFIIYDTAFTDITSGAYTTITTATASFQTLTFNLDGTVSGLVRPHATIGGTSNPAFTVDCVLNAEPR